MKPRFDYGQEVRVTRNVRNDGTFPGREVGELLLRRGATGFIRDVGTFLQDEIIYAVDFIAYGYRVGCREQELLHVDDPWIENKYEFRDRVVFAKELRIGDEVVAALGAEGEIVMVVRDAPSGIAYHVHVGGRTFQVPETALDGVSGFDERVRKTIEKGVDVDGETRGATLPWQSM